MPKEIAKKKTAVKKAEIAAPVASPARKTTAKAVAPAPAPPPAPAKAKAAPAKKAPAPKAPAPKAVKPASAKTTIVAKFDAGFGNSLFLRGEGAGLGWDKGVEMTCVSSDEWSFTVEGAKGPLAIKVLINDTTWSSGPNIEVPEGKTVVFTPAF